jgi:hypothetical protein
MRILIQLSTLMRIRIQLSTSSNADPDPAFYFHADPDPAFHPCGSGSSFQKNKADPNTLNPNFYSQTLRRMAGNHSCETLNRETAKQAAGLMRHILRQGWQ